MLLPLLLLSLGCPGPEPEADMTPTDTDMTVADMAQDTSGDVSEDVSRDMMMDAGPEDPDMGPAGACSWPAALIAGTPKTDALADSPARCGQPAHKWLREGPFGEVTQYGETINFKSTTLRVAIASQGVDPPDAIKYNSNIETFEYKTQDRGEVVTATAMLGWPEGAEELKGVLLLLHGTSGFTDKCAPALSTEGQALVALFTSMGYMVVAPDFLGLKALGEPSPKLHSYLSGQATAIASLDALRALPQIDPERRGGFCPPPETLVFGGSQGGHAAL